MRICTNLSVKCHPQFTRFYYLLARSLMQCNKKKVILLSAFFVSHIALIKIIRGSLIKRFSFSFFAFRTVESCTELSTCGTYDALCLATFCVL